MRDKKDKTQDLTWKSLCGKEDIYSLVDIVLENFFDLDGERKANAAEDLDRAIYAERHELEIRHLDTSPFREGEDIAAIEAALEGLQTHMGALTECLGKMTPLMRRLIADSTARLRKGWKRLQPIDGRGHLDNDFYVNFLADAIKDSPYVKYSSLEPQETADFLDGALSDPIMCMWILLNSSEIGTKHIERSLAYLRRPAHRPRRDDLYAFVSKLAAVWREATSREIKASFKRGQFGRFCEVCLYAAMPSSEGHDALTLKVRPIVGAVVKSHKAGSVRSNN